MVWEKNVRLSLLVWHAVWYGGALLWSWKHQAMTGNYSGVTAEMKSLLFHRPLENESIHLSQCQERKTHQLLPSPLLPVSASPQSSSPLRTTSTPLPKPTRDSCQGGVSVRKRRRLAASPGGLHWDASGMPITNCIHSS